PTGQGIGHVIEHHAQLDHSGSMSLVSRKVAALASHAPSTIAIYSDPNVLRADGKSVGRITAVASDILGVAVEENTLITFRAPKGTSCPVGGNGGPCPSEDEPEGDCIIVPTSDGVAEVDLLAPDLRSGEHMYMPVTVTAWNPYLGAVREQVMLYLAPGAIVGR